MGPIEQGRTKAESDKLMSFKEAYSLKGERCSERPVQAEHWQGCPGAHLQEPPVRAALRSLGAPGQTERGP